MEESTNFKKDIVLDASFVLCRMMPDEKENSEVWDVFNGYGAGQINFKAPRLLKYEVLNSIKYAVKCHRMSEIKSKTIISNFQKLEIDWVDVDSWSIFKLALKHDLTYYDACYLGLALENNWKLLSFDKRLMNAYKLYLN